MDEELRLKIQQAAQALLAEGAREVYLFGSAATGKMRPDSDIDMAVSGLPPERYFRAVGEVNDIVRRQVDLVDLDAGNKFTEYLKRKGKLQRVAAAR